jgi:hypothetical protein
MDRPVIQVKPIRPGFYPIGVTLNEMPVSLGPASQENENGTLDTLSLIVGQLTVIL